MKPKPLDSLNHLTVPVAIFNPEKTGPKPGEDALNYLRGENSDKIPLPFFWT
jgi:hypothetical protein